MDKMDATRLKISQEIMKFMEKSGMDYVLESFCSQHHMPKSLIKSVVYATLSWLVVQGFIILVDKDRVNVEKGGELL